MRTQDRGCPFKSTDCNESFIPYPYLLVCMGAEFSRPGPPQKLALRGPFMLGLLQKSVSTNRFCDIFCRQKNPKGNSSQVGLYKYIGFIKLVCFVLCTIAHL